MATTSRKVAAKRRAKAWASYRRREARDRKRAAAIADELKDAIGISPDLESTDEQIDGALYSLSINLADAEELLRWISCRRLSFSQPKEARKKR